MNNSPRKRVKQPARVAKAPLKSEVSQSSGSLLKPNVADPLSESERHRRVWAAYLLRGYTRRSFARAIGTNYHTVNRWDAGAATISLEMLERASELLGFTMDELCFGRRSQPLRSASFAAEPVNVSAPSGALELAPPAPPAPSAAVAPTMPRKQGAALSEPEIRALLDRQSVDPMTRAAFGEHAVSPAGRYQSFTAEYVLSWCAAYVATQDEHAALAVAVNTRAISEAVASGVSSVSPAALRASRRGPLKP